jgi:N-acetylglutamate synthase-like GNAT family acetyltransferase
MDKHPIRVVPASKSDLPAIEKLAKSLDLDCEDLSWDQFWVAKVNEKIAGIGRLRVYPECTEIATVGVLPEEQKKGIGERIVRELISRAPAEVFVTCVIPDFFNKMGFQLVKQYPAVLQKKVDFCKSYDFKDDEIFVMKFTK